MVDRENNIDIEFAMTILKSGKRDAGNLPVYQTLMQNLR
jgi:hypothetical protein